MYPRKDEAQKWELWHRIINTVRPVRPVRGAAGLPLRTGKNPYKLTRGKV